jgi:hypothetical protein
MCRDDMHASHQHKKHRCPLRINKEHRAFQTPRDTDLAVPTEASEIPVFQISVADFSQPRVIIPPALAPTTKTGHNLSADFADSRRLRTLPKGLNAAAINKQTSTSNSELRTQNLGLISLVPSLLSRYSCSVVK